MQTHITPFEVLKELAEQSVEASTYRQTTNDLTTAWTGIGFSLCGRQMLAPMGEVIEVANVPKCTLIPGAKSWVQGVANLRGRLLPVIDLEAFVGSKLAGNHSQHRVLIVEIGEAYVGLMVSRVFGLKHFAASEISDDYRSESELYANFIDGKAQEGELGWLKFSTAALLADKEFNDVACAQTSNTEVFARTVA